MKGDFRGYSRRAFTLMELLAAVAVVAILMALIVPGISKMKQEANSAKSVSNLRVLGHLNSLFAADNNGQLPYYNEPASTYKPNPTYRLWWFQYLIRDYNEGDYRAIHDPGDDFKTSTGAPRFTTMNTTTGVPDLTYSYAMNTSLPQPNPTGLTAAQKNARMSRLNWIEKPAQTAIYIDTCESGAIGPTTDTSFRYSVNGKAAHVLFCDGNVSAVPKETLLRSLASSDPETLKRHRLLWYGDQNATTQILH